MTQHCSAFSRFSIFWHLITIAIAVIAAATLGHSAMRRSDLPPFSTTADTGKMAAISPSGDVSWRTPLQLIASGSVTNNDLASWAGTGGKLADSGIPLANVVLVSRAVQAGTGLAVTNSGLLSADITMSLSAPVSIANGGTAAATAASGFANLQPLTTKGDLLTYSTTPFRLAVGTTGQLLQADSTASGGISWTQDVTGIAGATPAAAGKVGEVIRMTRVRSAAIALTSNTTCNIGAATCPSTGGTQSITLTAGDWSCQAMAGFTTGTSTSETVLRLAVSKTSATLPGTDTIAVPTSGEAYWIYATGADVPQSVSDKVASIPDFQVTVANGATTSLFLVAQATFTVSTLSVYGSLECRRMR